MCTVKNLIAEALSRVLTTRNSLLTFRVFFFSFWKSYSSLRLVSVIKVTTCYLTNIKEKYKIIAGNKCFSFKKEINVLQMLLSIMFLLMTNYTYSSTIWIFIRTSQKKWISIYSPLLLQISSVLIKIIRNLHAGWMKNEKN